MSKYDVILAEQLAELERIASKRVSIEQDAGTIKTAEQADLFFAELTGLESRFDKAMNCLHALFFADVHETREQYEQSVKAYVEYRGARSFSQRRRLGDIVPGGPSDASLTQKARLSAAEAREQKIDGQG